MANAAPVTNDTARLVAKTTFDVPELRFDFPGLSVGVAAYEAGPTGCTVFHFADDAMYGWVRVLP